MKGRLPVYRDSFFCGTERPDGLELTMTYENRLVQCDVFVDTRFEGYTDVLHGGMVFGIMDVMIWYAIFMETRKICMTRKTETEFLKPVMCNIHYTAKARFLYIDERDVHAEAWIENENGEICAKVNALFREARDLPASDFINRFDFTITTPEIRDHFLSLLK
jgi:acyl-coenzyme A thioesterase PaaI-like protein